MPEVLFFIEVPDLRADLRITTLTLDPSRENQKMKITNLVLSLALAGLCLNQASAQGIRTPSGSASRSIGDSSTDLRPTQFQAARSLSDRSVGYATANQQADHEQSVLSYGSDSSYGDYQGQTEYYEEPTQSYQASGSYGESYGAVSANRHPQVWFNSESLVWFTKNMATPALVNNSDFGVLPTTGAPGVQTMFGGGDGIDYGFVPGFRISGGMYLGPDQKVGIGGRGYGLLNASESYSRRSDGTGGAANPSLGLPFYNLFTNREDAFLVAYRDGVPPDIDGTVHARSDLDMYGADGSLYFLMARSDSMRMDLLGGYTFNILKSSVGVDSISRVASFPAVTQITNDLFETKNVFNGGHVGVLSSVNRSRVSFSTLAKVAFGSMQQTGSIRGYSSVDGTVLGAGILTQPSNIGNYSRDSFAFIPELGVKLGLAATENVQFTLGYTMMMWSGVALAGDQIDNVVDPTQLILPNAGTRPNPLFVEDTFWMQGVDLGMTFAF